MIDICIFEMLDLISDPKKSKIWCKFIFYLFFKVILEVKMADISNLLLCR